jgi:predicted HicB family RNase H-like nuclease
MEAIMAKKMISLEISDELREALRVEAFKRSVSLSALIRQLLESQVLIKGESGDEQN